MPPYGVSKPQWVKETNKSYFPCLKSTDEMPSYPLLFLQSTVFVVYPLSDDLSNVTTIWLDCYYLVTTGVNRTLIHTTTCWWDRFWYKSRMTAPDVCCYDGMEEHGLQKDHNTVCANALSLALAFSPPLFINIYHYNDVMIGAMASQITSLTIVYSTVYSGAD